ncbi:MAG: methylated-DNA--[protein]-cysteine S-methyltransferase [Saccharofermentans sp.]|nr:methylated-DNA--[protein]-cysteine S-methyltransferase [Saccharofermentans sp.]
MEEEQLPYLPDELAKAYVELREYFDSARSGFDINVRFSMGTPFQKKVWNALNTIPYGGTASYEDIALKLTAGDLKEARKITRAVGAACSDNPVAVVVPCHRVIGKDGSIVGYSAGIDIKDYLLLHESFTAVTPLISKEG